MSSQWLANDNKEHRQHGPNTLSCYLWNARSICNQLTSLQTLTHTHNPDIICITETWLKNYFFDNELQPPNYNIYRNDRKERGGGVLLAVNNNISSNLILSPNDIEMLSISVCTQEILHCHSPVLPTKPTFLSSKASSVQTTSVKILYCSETLISLTLTGIQCQAQPHSPLIFVTFSLNSIWSNLSPHRQVDVILTNTSIINETQVITPLPCGLSSDHYLVHFSLLINYQLSHKNFII